MSPKRLTPRPHLLNWANGILENVRFAVQDLQTAIGELLTLLNEDRPHTPLWDALTAIDTLLDESHDALAGEFEDTDADVPRRDF